MGASSNPSNIFYAKEVRSMLMEKNLIDISVAKFKKKMYYKIPHLINKTGVFTLPFFYQYVFAIRAKVGNTDTDCITMKMNL